MFRHIALILCLVSILPAAHASDAGDLSPDLSRFITVFDLNDLTTQTLSALCDIVDDADRSHGQKVLALHSLLDRHGALGHADMHGAQDLITASIAD